MQSRYIELFSSTRAEAAHAAVQRSGGGGSSSRRRAATGGMQSLAGLTLGASTGTSGTSGVDVSTLLQGAHAIVSCARSAFGHSSLA